ncbi:BACON domain-containing carbohydrate-binding protein [uncultured Bacteroides sp.]|uniref:BACON domain-containing protein n=1 Tax=uncultured Bacteroides sp. TaxID=162156 RepID=UPI002600BE1A|nr:BACON domain-containing carbohydrate-binding protein [uncultured Bacteroides sp.]
MRVNKICAGLLVCLCFLLILASCKEEEDEVINISMSEITFGSKSEVKSVEVYANTSWSAEITPSASSSWISLNIVSGKAGTSTIQITLTENDTADERTAEIIFRGSSTSQTLKVTQEKNEILKLPYEEIGFWQIGGALPLEIERNIEYTVEIETEAREWIKLGEPKGLSPDLIYIHIEENFSELPRIGHVYVKGKDSTLADTLLIDQDPLELNLSRNTLDFPKSAESKTVIATTSHTDHYNIPLLKFELPEDAKDWCTVEVDNQGILSISVSENRTGIDRKTDLTVIASILKETVHITQRAETNEYYQDGDFIQLQAATKGKGINIVIMGDGFLKTDLNKGGYYETLSRKAERYFFNIEPYKSYREYFNVYMIAAVSEEEGVSEEIPGRKVNNRFGSTFGEGTNIQWDEKICSDYMDLIPGLDKVVEVTGILILNSHKYAGTTMMYSNGFSVAACPISGDTPNYDLEALIHHEAGGHAFGRLADEYRYYDVPIPLEDINDLKLWQSYGYYHNVDLTNDLTQILWTDFTKIPKYAYVGAFEGGFLYNYGVWRPEYLSCMENNMPYFNAQSRWRIVERIAKLAGTPITFDDFVRQDHVSPPTDAMTKAARNRKHIPLGKPILIIRD